MYSVHFYFDHYTPFLPAVNVGYVSKAIGLCHETITNDKIYSGQQLLSIGHQWWLTVPQNQTLLQKAILTKWISINIYLNTFSVSVGWVSDWQFTFVNTAFSEYGFSEYIQK